MVTQDLGRAGIQLAAFSRSLLDLGEQGFELVSLCLVQPAAIDSIQLGSGAGRVQEDQRLGRLRHVLLGRFLEPLLASPRSIEVEGCAAADLGAEKLEQLVRGGLLGERQQALVVIGSRHRLDAAGQLLGSILGVCHGLFQSGFERWPRVRVGVGDDRTGGGEVQCLYRPVEIGEWGGVRHPGSVPLPGVNQFETWGS